MQIRLISITSDCEKHISYCARVSSPKQDNPDCEKLLKYCINNKHWSIFEMGTMCVEITTSRAIAQQILRHRSFHFQEFSQRYAEITNFEIYEARRQDSKNRQNSINDMTENEKGWFLSIQNDIHEHCQMYYEEALSRGIAKEQARFLLPVSVQTKMYMSGTIRDWIHYINVRTDVSTQKEHRDIAEEIRNIFKNELKTIAIALNW